MNRLQKINLGNVVNCLQNININALDAIIVATGWGCIDSTYKFVERLYDRRDLPANPTSFIQSTHNTMAAQTAIYLNCNACNNTLTDNQSPFELALDNALICMHNDRCSNVLLSACDELTPQLIDILGKIAGFGKPKILGEGGACFLLSKEKQDNIAELKHFASLSTDDLQQVAEDLSNAYSVDYVFTSQKERLTGASARNLPQIIYTDYFGHFPTSHACGFWLAVHCLNTGNPPATNARNIMLISGNRQKISHIIIVGK
jgi:hypothetical protein